MKTGPIMQLMIPLAASSLPQAVPVITFDQGDIQTSVSMESVVFHSPKCMYFFF